MPGAQPEVWFCRVCRLPTASWCLDKILKAFDSTPLDNDVMHFITYLFHRVHEQEQEIAELKCLFHNIRHTGENAAEPMQREGR